MIRPKYWSDRVGFVSQPELAVASPRAGSWAWSVFVVALAALLLATSGCATLSSKQVALIREARRQNLAMSEAEDLPLVAREIALHNYDAWAQIDRAVTGAPLSTATRARLGLPELPEGER